MPLSELCSSSSGFYAMPFDASDPIAVEAADFWHRRIVDISQETLDRWAEITRAYYAMRSEQLDLYRSLPGGFSGVLVDHV